MAARRPRSVLNQNRQNELLANQAKAQSLLDTLKAVFGRVESPLAYIQNRGIMLGDVFLFASNEQQKMQDVERVATVYREGMLSLEVLMRGAAWAVDTIERTKEWCDKQHSDKIQRVQGQLEAMRKANHDLYTETEWLRQTCAEQGQQWRNTIADLQRKLRDDAAWSQRQTDENGYRETRLKKQIAALKRKVSKLEAGNGKVATPRRDNVMVRACETVLL